MARPKKEGMDYFPHDTDASGDEKIDAMRALFGNDGYAFYFILCERIYRTSDAELDLSKVVLIAPIVKKLFVTMERFNEMLNAAFELELFDPAVYADRKALTSNGIKKRFLEVEGMRKRWRKQKENTDSSGVIHAENPEENKAENQGDSAVIRMENAEETPESKVKESKVKEIKERENMNRSELEDRLRILINELEMKGAGIDGLETVYWYIGRVEPGVIEKALKKSQGKHINFFVSVINDWIAKGKTTVESLSPITQSRTPEPADVPEAFREPQPETASKAEPDPEFESLLAQMRSGGESQNEFRD